MIQASQLRLSPKEFDEFQMILKDPERLSGLYHVLLFELLKEKDAHHDGEQIRLLQQKISS